MKIIKTVASALLFCLPVGAVASPFSGVDSPIEAIEPIKPIKPIEKIKVKTEAVKPVVRKIIPQKVKVLAENKFMILPEEYPLAHGTVSLESMGIEKKIEAPAPTMAAENSPLKAKLVEDNDGNKIFRLQGESMGKMAKWQPFGLKPMETAEAKKTAPKPATKKPVKPKIKIVTNALGFEYSVDNIAPNGDYANKLAKFIGKLKGKKISHLNVVSQSSHVPLADAQELPRNRWQYVADILEKSGVEFKGIRTSEILLTDSANQFLELEITFKHK